MKIMKDIRINDGFDWDGLQKINTENKIILSFSCGKDSLASWIECRNHGYEVVPYYMDLIPGLSFVQESIDYYEKYFQTKITRSIHPNFYRYIHNDRYQPFHRVDAIEQMSLPIFDYDDIRRAVEQQRANHNTWQAIGTRKAESISRAWRMSKNGMNHKKRNFHPIYTWRKDDVLACIKREGCKLSVDYRLFGRSFDGIYARYLRPIKENYFADYKLILEYFPYADSELHRYEIMVKNGKI